MNDREIIWLQVEIEQIPSVVENEDGEMDSCEWEEWAKEKGFEVRGEIAWVPSPISRWVVPGGRLIYRNERLIDISSKLEWFVIAHSVGARCNGRN